MNELLLSSDVFQVEIVPTLFSFTLCVLMSFILRYFYIRRSYSLTGKSHIGSILPILSTVVFLVIVVVKSSLALSLGLVGALSIVRFRTPIKEPEELVYLFLAISIGLGFASGQNLITTVLTLLILLIIYFWLSNRSLSSVTEYNLILNWKDKTLMFEDLIDQVKSCSKEIKLIRVDNSPTESTAVLLVSPEDDSFVDLITNKLIPLDNEISVTFFEAKTNW
uniref:DUF4956 domain-containing protein n=1 Tax=uncultured gamma proteobacterium HF0500_05P21 TaxID=723572 RepID=E7C4S5_9GAMM|nr:hypothetical protein [uncultured gamma proteobacterium HF0500_05P21]